MNESRRTDLQEIQNPMANAISIMLMAGVGLSAIFVAAGLVVLAITGKTGYQDVGPAPLLASQAFVEYPRSLDSIWPGVLALKSFALIEFGLLILIATPVFRVAAAFVLFLIERDMLYVAITMAVLAVLLISIFTIN